MKKSQVTPIGKICAVLLLLALLFSLAACSAANPIAGKYAYGERFTITLAKDGTCLCETKSNKFYGTYRYDNGILTLSAFCEGPPRTFELNGENMCTITSDRSLIIPGEIKNMTFERIGDAPETIKEN